MMRALDPEVHDAVLRTIQPLFPQPERDPKGRGRPRISDKVCFHGIWLRLVTGLAWETIEYLVGYQVSDTTLRSRRDEWISAGVFTDLIAHAYLSYDKIVGFDLSEVAIDGSNHRSPCGGEGTGYNPFDRGKLGWKWLITVDAKGIPLGWVTDGANRNDFALLTDVMDATIANHDHVRIGQLNLDRGFSYKCTPDRLANYEIERIKTKPRQARHQARKLVGFGGCWIVESANSWLTNYGQLRRNTDRKTIHRHTALCLAITILITHRLIDHRNTHHRDIR